jgi:hypothetical protein
MEKKLKYLLLVLVYIIGINILFNFLSISNYQNIGNINDKSWGTNIIMGVQESVDISVTRPRFYGTYYETASTSGKVIILYSLKYIRIPIRYNSLNFIFFHMIFIGVIALELYKDRRLQNEKNSSSIANPSY